MHITYTQTNGHRNIQASSSYYYIYIQYIYNEPVILFFLLLDIDDVAFCELTYEQQQKL